MAGMSNDEAKELINAINETGYELNDWEEGFIKSVSEWVDKGFSPSDKQAAKIRQIYEKATEEDENA